MNRHTGQEIDGDEDLIQSITDILTTLLGTRLARRDYGGLLPLLIDQPQNETLRLRLFASSALAIARWENRFKLSALSLSVTSDRKAQLMIAGTRRDRPGANSLTRLTIPLSLS